MKNKSEDFHPKKIGFITPGFSANENDWCIPVLYNLVRELAREHEIHVFALRYPHRTGTYPLHGATVHALGGAARAGVARLPILFRTLTAILKEARRKPFDLLHAFWADEPGLVAGIVGKLRKVPNIISLMGGELVGLPEIGYGGMLSAFNRTVTEWALRHANVVTTGSTYLANLVSSSPRSLQVQVLPLGVDTNLFHPGDTNAHLFPSHNVHLLHAASLVPVKDQTTLLHAFARTTQTHPNTHLHLLGDGPLRPTLEHLANALGISSSLTFHGSILHHETLTFYQSTNLCVLSSRFESQGMVVLEAAACGVTTVGTAVGILPELVPPEQVVPVGDVEALAVAIITALSNPARLREIGQKHAYQVRERYSLAKCVQELKQIYGEVLGKIEREGRFNATSR